MLVAKRRPLGTGKLGILSPLGLGVKQKLYEVYGWLFRGLFHNVSNSVGDRSLEHYTLDLNASKVHTHELARFEHHARAKILPL